MLDSYVVTSDFSKKPSHQTILLGLSGGIAAYKLADLASLLAKRGYDVHVMMTRHATEFITPLTFETLTGNRCLVDSFDRNFQWDLHHISLAKKADVMLIAPATANMIAKLAHGMADELLTTTTLAMRGKVLVAPSMNTAMYGHPATQDNIETLRRYGYIVIDPENGMLACKDIGQGRLPKLQTLVLALEQQLAGPKDLAGLSVLVTAGPTREAIDPVRFLTNHSTGKMGVAVATAALLRGATVTLVAGPGVDVPDYGMEVVSVTSAEEMYDAVMARSDQMDFIVKAAAVADFTPIEPATHKIKKSGQGQADHQDGYTFAMRKTTDILSVLGQHKRPHQVLCGFAMETEQLIPQATKKLAEKNADLIAANNLLEPGAGFGGETNLLTLITKDQILPLSLLSKQEAANEILTQLLWLHREKQAQTSGAVPTESS